MRWKFFDLQAILDDIFVDNWLYPWRVTDDRRTARR